MTEAGPLTSLRAWATLRSVDLSPMGADAARDLLARLAGEGRIDAEPDAMAELIAVCEGSTVALCVAGSLLADRPDRADRPVARLVGRLRDDGRTLRELSSDADLSVEVVLDAAYRRLPPTARHCYRVLGAHPGLGDVSADAVAVALGVDRHDALDALDRLTRARLVDEANEGRYRTSGLVRRHARARADDDGAAGREEMERHLVAYYWARALAAEQLVMPGRGWREAIWPDLQSSTEGLTAPEAWAWLEVERTNLRAAVDLAHRLGDDARTAQLCVALWPLHHQRRLPHDMVAVNTLGVAAAAALGDDLCASLLWSQVGRGYRELGALDRAGDALTAGLACAERAASVPATASALEALGQLRTDEDRIEDATALLRRNLALAEELDVPRRTALARFHLAKVEPAAVALGLLDRARATFEDLGEPLNLAKVDLWRGRYQVELGRLEEAERTLSAAAAAADRGHWHVERAQASEGLADLAAARGDAALVRAHLEDALVVYRHHHLTTAAETVEGRLTQVG